eukprot:g3475.t1
MFIDHSKMRLVAFALFAMTDAASLRGQIFAATYSPNNVTATAPGGCASGTVGLIDPLTGQWNESSCIKAPWADDAETASVMADGTVSVYVTPADGDDTYLARVDFDTGKVTKAIVGGDQGNLRCTPAGKCYGVSPGSSKQDPTALIEVDAVSGDSKAVLKLKKYAGYSVDGAVIDADANAYHAILVGAPHNATGGLSNQYLVTIALDKLKVQSEVPVGGQLMGPLAWSRTLGLLTFGSDRFDDGLIALDGKTGKQTRTTDAAARFGTVVQFSGAYSAGMVYAVNVYPHPTKLFAVDVSGAKKAKIAANNTFKGAAIHALAAGWD